MSDDGTFCNGTDLCSGGTCSTHAGNPCDGTDGDSDCPSEMHLVEHDHVIEALVPHTLEESLTDRIQIRRSRQGAHGGLSSCRERFPL
jgi:hypothetical protein